MVSSKTLDIPAEIRNRGSEQLHRIIILPHWNRDIKRREFEPRKACRHRSLHLWRVLFNGRLPLLEISDGADNVSIGRSRKATKVRRIPEIVVKDIDSP